MNEPANPMETVNPVLLRDRLPCMPGSARSTCPRLMYTAFCRNSEASMALFWMASTLTAFTQASSSITPALLYCHG